MFDRARRTPRETADALRTELWPLPALAVGAAVALGVGLPRLDAHIDAGLPPALNGYLFGGDAAAARTVLDTIAGSLITVTALTFSLTVVTLQLASSQFSPRLLRTFARDIFVQATLALFLATFTYALTVLRTVRNSNGAESGFVPEMSVTVSFVLTVASVVGLVLFLAHLTQQIRVEGMLRNVHKEASRVIARLPPKIDDEQAAGEPLLPAAAGAAGSVPTDTSGFLIRVDDEALLEAAVRFDAVVHLTRHPGSSVIAGTPLASWYSCPAAGGSRADHAQLVSCVQQAVRIGYERTSEQDPAFGLRQVTDVVVKALSPGINDPTTAIHALGHSAALLGELLSHEMGPRVRRDGNGRVRVVIAGHDFPDFLELAIDQPRRYGANDPAVTARIYELLREVALLAGPTHHRPITEQLERLRSTVARQTFDETDSIHFAQLDTRVRQALTGRW